MNQVRMRAVHFWPAAVLSTRLEAASFQLVAAFLRVRSLLFFGTHARTTKEGQERAGPVASCGRPPFVS